MNPKKLLFTIFVIQTIILIIAAIFPEKFMQEILPVFQGKSLDIIYQFYYILIMLGVSINIIIFFASQLSNKSARKLLLAISIYSTIMFATLLYLFFTSSLRPPASILFLLLCFAGYTLYFSRITRFDYLDE